jgi:hypothetical protein
MCADSPVDEMGSVSAKMSGEKLSLISAKRAPDKTDDSADNPEFSNAVEKRSDLAQSVFFRDSTQQMPLHDSSPVLIEDKTVEQDRVAIGEVTDFNSEYSSSTEPREIDIREIAYSDTCAFITVKIL